MSHPLLNALIVEDSPIQAQFLSYILQEKGFKTSSARDGKEALSLLKTFEPTIIISDILMPEMDGFQMCQHIRQNRDYDDVPIILLTSLSDPNDILSGLECGADCFMTKPFEEAFLLSQIDFILKNRDLRKTAPTGHGIPIFFEGKPHFIKYGQARILDLLFSIFQNAVHKNKQMERTNQDLEKANSELKKALDTIKTLKNFLPICCNCKKIRDDQGYWEQIESYISHQTGVEFSHGICPECIKKLYGQEMLEAIKDKEKKEIK